MTMTFAGITASATAGSATAFRDGMSRVTSAVHLVTTSHGGTAVGVTATAVASVSDAPPTLLICLHRKGRLHGLLQTGSSVAVNALNAEQRQLATAFAGVDQMPMDARFALGSWHIKPDEAPILHGCVASFACTVHDIHSVGSHSILICRVRKVRIGDALKALVYGGRRFTDVNLPPPQTYASTIKS